MERNKQVVSHNIAALARSYNVLAYERDLKDWVGSAYRGNDLDSLRKPELHRLINDLLLHQYNGECTLKAKLAERFLKQKVTAAFEIKVGKSRADFLTINGDSRSFEIKSELDNLQKLPKQIGDYQQVFDYNYLVIHEKHYVKALQLVPEHYGVMVLHGKRLTEDRPANHNTGLSSLAQLRLFTKKELAQTFRVPGITPEEVAINFESIEINQAFKSMLKNRYAKRWSFLVDHHRVIHPIDYQFFFQHNIAPHVIYGQS